MKRAEELALKLWEDSSRNIVKPDTRAVLLSSFNAMLMNAWPVDGQVSDALRITDIFAGFRFRNETLCLRNRKGFVGGKDEISC